VKLNLSQVLECLPLGVIICDLEGNCIGRNRWAGLLFRDDHIQQGPLREVLDEPHAGPLRGVYQAARDLGFALPEKVEVPLSDGTELTVGLSASLLRDEEDRPEGVVLLLEDWSAQEALLQRTQRAAESHTLLTMAAHEIRNPLSALDGCLSLLLESQLEGRAHRLASLARKGSSRVAHLTRDLLDSARLESGAIELELKPLDICVLLTDIVDGLRVSHPEASLTLELAPDLPLIPADAQRLEGALTNLVENAIKYSPPGAPITVRAHLLAKVLEVEIQDQGRGIPAESLAHVFERFYRVPEAGVRRCAGSGIGLSVVKATIEAHGGAVDVTSTVGVGSTFSVRLKL